MIDSAYEHDNPKVPKGSILVLELTPQPGESVEAFGERLKGLEYGAHQMEFKRLAPGKYRLSVELNPQWDTTAEPDDLANVDQAQLLEEFHRTATRTHNNKIDYPEG